jgi:hypothetical protein
MLMQKPLTKLSLSGQMQDNSAPAPIEASGSAGSPIDIVTAAALVMVESTVLVINH